MLILLHHETNCPETTLIERCATSCNAAVSKLEPRLDWKRLLAEAARRFGISEFRPGQRELIECVMSGRNALGILPTGAGKSLCYQLPALFLEGLVIVVSPLIALMQDQQEHMEDADISALRLDSSIEVSAQKRGEIDLKAGVHEIVMVTPERLQNPEHLDALKQRRVALFVVDEAHCVSSWGHDFRPAYLELHHAISELGHPPVLALTATAPPDRVDDILDTLGIPDARIVQEAIDRDNLSFEVHRTVNRDEKRAQLLRIVEQATGSGIVYAATVREVNELHEWLEGLGHRSVRYHGRLSMRVRERSQNSFMRGECPLIVATNAFGLGVDKPDVRFVVHWNFPDSVESYYQEAGRAGRDGKPAVCTLLYQLEDKRVRSFFLGGKHPRSNEIQRVLTALQDGNTTGRVHSVTELAAATHLSDRRLRIICAGLEAAHVLTRRRGGRELTRVMSEREALRFEASFEHHLGADRHRLEEMMRYGESVICRMQFLREYFGEISGAACGRCDNCLHPISATAAKSSAIESKQSAVPTHSVGDEVRHRRFGLGKIISADAEASIVSFPRWGERHVLASYLVPQTRKNE